MKRNSIKAMTALILAVIILLFAACGNSAEIKSPDPVSSPEPTAEQEPPRAGMNDPQTIIEGIESMLGPSYKYYSFSNHLELPADFVPGPNAIMSIDAFEWDLGALSIRMNESAEVNETMADIRDHIIVNNVAAALFAYSVRDNSPEDGQKIADALHIGDMFFPEKYDKYTYVLDHNGYYYVYDIGNRFLRLIVMPNYIKLAYESCIFFDIDGNEAKNPGAGIDGYDEEGNLSKTTGDAQKDALIKSLMPPDSEIDQAKADSVSINSFTDYPDAIAWYEENLPALGFSNLIPEDQQALLDADPESKIFSGIIGSQPVTIMIRDWSGTVDSGDMSLITIMFIGFGE